MKHSDWTITFPGPQLFNVGFAEDLANELAKTIERVWSERGFRVDQNEVSVRYSPKPNEEK